MLYRWSKHTTANIIAFVALVKAVTVIILQSMPSLVGSAIVITIFTMAVPLRIIVKPISAISNKEKVKGRCRPFDPLYSQHHYTS